jgi:hypothetical protein
MTPAYIQSLLIPNKERRFVSMYEVIPEYKIKAAAEYMSDEDDNNSFSLLLKYGERFKTAALTPIYIINSNTAEVYVTSVEKMEQKFH